MLLKAEALSQLLREGGDQETVEYNRTYLQQAFALVNAVNKRALCQSNLVDTLVASDYTSKSQMETLVLQERQRELMFEGKRWFDLVRYSQRAGNTKLLTQAALRKATTGASLISNHLTKMDAIYWPYNNDEMKVNANLVQNPAFSSGENDSYQKTTKQ
jgi:protein involved in temperature-dependent protein secretion